MAHARVLVAPCNWWRQVTLGGYLWQPITSARAVSRASPRLPRRLDRGAVDSAPRVVLRAGERCIGAGFDAVAVGMAALLGRGELRHRSEDAKDGEAPATRPWPTLPASMLSPPA